MTGKIRSQLMDAWVELRQRLVELEPFIPKRKRRKSGLDFVNPGSP